MANTKRSPLFCFAVPTSRTCRVTIRDVEGLTHSVKMSASSLFEAAAAAVTTFRDEKWAAGALAPARSSAVAANLHARAGLPPGLGCHDDHSLALVGVPLEGATLLHVATEYEELDVARWLLDAGTDPNVRARVDADGFGGHTALFQCVVGYNAGRTDDPLARPLLDRGVDPNACSSIRTRLPFARDKGLYEYRDVTPLGWGAPSTISPTSARRRCESSPNVEEAPNLRILVHHGMPEARWAIVNCGGTAGR